MIGRIMMVDDEPDAEELFRQNFRKEIRKGVYTFVFARSGAEALQRLGEEESANVALVLSDINMPGMSGIELLGHIKAKWPDVPVFIVTAYGDSATASKAFEQGAAQFLTKPLEFVNLKSELAEILQEQSS